MEAGGVEALFVGPAPSWAIHCLADVGGGEHDRSVTIAGGIGVVSRSRHARGDTGMVESWPCAPVPSDPGWDCWTAVLTTNRVKQAGNKTAGIESPLEVSSPVMGAVDMRTNLILIRYYGAELRARCGEGGFDDFYGGSKLQRTGQGRWFIRIASLDRRISQARAAVRELSRR